MIGRLILIVIGLWIAGVLPFPWIDVLYSDFWGDWAGLGERYGWGAWWGRARPFIGWALVLVAVWGMFGRFLTNPLRYGYIWRFLTGRRIFGSARWAKWKDLIAAGMDKPGGLYLGTLGKRDFFHNGEGHILTIGGSGGGKSTGLVVPALINLTEGSVIVTDPSGELTAMTHQHRATIGPVVYLNPFKASFDVEPLLQFPDTGFNPMDTLDPKAETFFSDCSAFARFLMVTDRRESGSYWNDEGAAFLSLMVASIKLYDHKDLHNLAFLYQAVRDSIPAMMTRMEWLVQRNHPAIRDEAQRFLEIMAVPPHWGGIESKAALATERYAPSTPLGEHTKKSGFDLASLRTEKVTVFLLVPPKMLPVSLPWPNMLLGVFGGAIGTLGSNAPITLLIDEAPALGYLPDLRTQMAQFRKFGLRVWIFTQTWAALAAEELYGATGMREIYGLAKVKQFFAVEEKEVQELVSQAAGQESKANFSSGGGISDVSRPLISPDQVRGLRKWHQIIIRSGMDSASIKAKLVPYFDRKEWQALVGKNPYKR